MAKVTASAFEQNVDDYFAAAESEPLIIIDDGRAPLVVITAEDYRILRDASDNDAARMRIIERHQATISELAEQ